MTGTAALDGGQLTGLLPEWLPRQRWFGGKGRPLHRVDVLASTALTGPDPALDHVLVGVDHGDEVARYQLLVGRRGELPQRLEHAAIGQLGDECAYDAAHDAELTRELLVHVAAADTVGALHFGHLTGTTVDTSLVSIVMAAEQSNTSLVYGDDYVLKLFRRLSPGVNPDLEVTRALAEHGCRHIVPPLGWISSELDGEPTTLAMMQPFLRSASEGWALATTSVRDLYAEGDLHADEVGGDFAGESERLGAATATVHETLAAALPTRIAGPDEAAAAADQMHQRLEAAVAVVDELSPYAAAVHAVYDAVATWPHPVRLQRVHGDFHLGQVLRTDTGWVLLDFEGEPARSLAERRALASPLRDVAGMLRSFDYAARHLLTDRPGQGQLEYRATEWADRNRDAFCEGYASSSGHDPRDEGALLRAYELDKAVYEVVYEARNRPTWLPIPLGSIDRLVG